MQLLLRILTSIALCASFSFFVAPARAQDGWGAAAIDDALYFTDLLRGTVWRLDRDGSRTAVLRDIHCHNLAPGPDGSLYGEAVGAGTGGSGGFVSVWRIGRDGVVSFPLPSSRELNPTVWISYDAAGNGYSWRGETGRVSEILKRSPAGDVAVLSGGAWGFTDGSNNVAQFGQVGGLAVTPEGTLFVLDSGHLRRVSADGTTLTLARNVADPRTGGLPGAYGLFNHSVGVAVAADESVYVVDHYDLKIVRWHQKEGARTLIDSRNWISRITGGSWGWAPTGIAVSGSELFVVETLTLPPLVNDLVGSPRISKLRADGSLESIASVNDWRIRATAGALGASLILCVVLWRRRCWRSKRAASESRPWMQF